MSQSTCIKCGSAVAMYEKYCGACLETFHLRQDPTWHKYHLEWDTEAEVKADAQEEAPADEKPVTKPPVVIRPVTPNGRHGRVACAGGCGEMVLPLIGECRKCKKARLREEVKGKGKV